MNSIQELYEYRSVLGKGGNGLVIEGVAKQDLIAQPAHTKNDDGFYTTGVLDCSLKSNVKLVKPSKDRVAIKIVEKKRINNWIMTRDSKIPFELYCLLSCRHPNIINLYGYYQDTDFYYYIMELPMIKPLQEPFGKSRDLFEFIESNEYPQSLVKHIFRQLVDAVEFLHQQRICHGDIKDENILLDENNHVSLIDFGAAQELGITNNKHFKGTVQYQAPEVFSIHDYDNEKAECWSLGIVLYALLFKRMPFSSLQEIREGHVKCWNPKYVGGYKVCLGFLEKDPDIRCNIEQIKKQSWLIK